MKDFLESIFCQYIRYLLSLRYRIRVSGFASVSQSSLPKKGGILFLSNHAAEIDPLILLSLLWSPFRPHPIAIEYLFRKPFLGNLLKKVGAFPVPNFDTSSNSYKRKRIEKTYQQIFSALDAHENLILYPAGGLKSGAEEMIGGASGVTRILEERPDVNIVLIRITGLWGSSFSKALTGKTPDLMQAFLNGFKVLIRNALFFAPRRQITVELTPAPSDFPWKGSRLEINRYLERWFNKNGPEPLTLVPYSHFHSELPQVFQPPKEEKLTLDAVSSEIQELVFEEIAKLTQVQSSEILIESDLSQDLGLDSLDIAQLILFLKEQFGIQTLHATELTTVGSVIAFAAKLRQSAFEESSAIQKEEKWNVEKGRPQAIYPQGDSIPLVFLRTCSTMGSACACTDAATGEISYKRMKLGVLLLAEAIARMPGTKIGIMMPASVAVNIMILATMIAGKIPVMINWTLGERNLRSILDQSGIEATLTSWNFIEKLEHVELDGLDEQLILIEELKQQFSIFDKIKAFYRSFKKPERLLNLFKAQFHEDETAVILFTSGTESFPKGVPLSHKNILTNQRGAYELAEIASTDILLGALPPFHSFGFSVTGLLPLLAGLKVAYTPNPTDGKKMAEAIDRWRVTLLCLAPTFLKNLLRVSTESQLKSLKYIVTGAEKTAPELYDLLKTLNPNTVLLEGYGITECAPILTLNPPHEPTQGVGRPLPRVEIRIVHPETFELQPIGGSGLILASGPNIFKGYLDPNLPSPFFEQDRKPWYLTGDLGYLDARGYLTLSGRLKRFVKIGGEMVSLAAIEEALHEQLSKAGKLIENDFPILAICALEQEGKKGEIHLFTIFDLPVEEANLLLRESGMSNLIKIRSAKKIRYIPLLGSGKIDYRALVTKLEG